MRIIQEAFTNIGKHACARHVQVTLATTAAGFEAIVADDGQGFDPQEQSASGRTFGLRIMQERAAEIGASVILMAKQGVDVDQFQAVEKSFSVQSKLQRARQQMAAYKVDGVPMFIVNGKYRIDGTIAGSEAGMFEALDQLVAQELKSLRK